MFDRLLDFLNSGGQPPVRQVYHSGECVPFYAFRSTAVPQERGAAALTLEPGFLHAYAVLEDTDPVNRADRDNAETWKLGDVFEFFFQPAGHEDYYEFHSTPEGIRLQLHIPDYRNFRDVPHEEKICSCGLAVRNRIDREHGLWYSELTVPAPGPADGARIAFARYNYNKDGKPEISSFPPVPATIHEPPVWPTFKEN